MKNLPLEKKRWFLIPLGIIIYMCLGTVYSWSIFKRPLESELYISSLQSNIPYMLFLFFFAVFMAISGRFINRHKPRFIIGFGGLLVGLGWILSGFFKDIGLISLSYGVIGGSGVGIVYGVPIAVISRWFPDKRGLAMGLVISGFGLSPLVTAPFARFLIELYGPFNAFKILGFIFFVLISLIGFSFNFPPSNFSVSVSQMSQRKIMAELDTKEMLKSSKFYGLWICYTIGTLIGLMIIGITSPVGEELVGLEPKFIAGLISLFAIFNALGRPLFGWITDKIYPLKASMLSYIIAILASVLMITTRGSILFIYILSFALFWLILGSWLAIAPASTIILFGEKNYSKNYGVVFTAYGLGAVLGGLISGMLRDLLGSYFYVFYVIIFLSLIGIIVALTLLKE